METKIPNAPESANVSAEAESNNDITAQIDVAAANHVSEPVAAEVYDHGHLQASGEWSQLTELQLTPVDSQYAKSVLLTTAPIALLVLVIIGAILVAAQPPLIMAMIIASCAFILALLVTTAIYKQAKTYCYGVFNKEFVMREGLFWISTTALPYTRLQHANISQGPIERKFNLVTLKCFSAGSGSAEIDLPGLNAQEAEHLRQHILHCATAQAPATEEVYISPASICTSEPNTTADKATDNLLEDDLDPLQVIEIDHSETKRTDTPKEGQ
ncbi:PH domain-containing protein [Shewanella maritima]|nr:PH domain-containing protein [Shewanella maritima]